MAKLADCYTLMSGQERVILITGATSGIGKALAVYYRKQSARLVLVGRKPLSELPTDFYTEDNYCQVDLAQTDCADTVDDWLSQRRIQHIDLLVHNAGIGFVGELREQLEENIRRLVAVNLQAPIALTHKLLPTLRGSAQSPAKIVFISSVVSVLPAPDYAVYAATKAALDGFVRNLQIELNASPQYQYVKAQLVHPGATRTEMHAKSGVTLDRMNWEKFPAADVVAEQIVQAIDRGRRTAAIGLSNQLLRGIGRHFPRIVEWGIKRAATKRQTDLTSPLADDKHCVITGAADGIGKALAQQAAAQGYRITGIDIDAQRAEQTRNALIEAGAKADFIIGNLSRADDLAQIKAELDTYPAIDLLIHNAGINAVGAFATSAINHQQRVIEVNLIAPLLLTAHLLRQGKLKNGSTLIFISSLSYFASYPGAAVYAATKDGLSSFASSLSVALASHSIHVLTVYPGPTRTAHARRYSPDNRREERRMYPEQLASYILQANRRRQRILIPGWGNRIFAAIGHSFPSFAEWVMRKAIWDKLEGMN